MKISKQIREEAALICAIAACGGVWMDAPQYWSRACAHVADAVGSSSAAFDLALSAWKHAFDVVWDFDLAYAEAEVLLRTGWTPD